MPDHHLIAKDGRLYLDDRILVVRHAEDCDTIQWPNPNEKHLEAALFDEGNMEAQPGPVFLPDGRKFGEIVRCGFNKES